jgi:hypothetical protein
LTGFSVILLGLAIIFIGNTIPYLPQDLISRIIGSEILDVSKKITDIGYIIILAGILSSLILAVMRQLKIIR